jgi:hypothetical protein
MEPVVGRLSKNDKPDRHGRMLYQGYLELHLGSGMHFLEAIIGDMVLGWRHIPDKSIRGRRNAFIRDQILFFNKDVIANEAKQSYGL